MEERGEPFDRQAWIKEARERCTTQWMKSQLDELAVSLEKAWDRGAHLLSSKFNDFAHVIPFLSARFRFSFYIVIDPDSAKKRAIVVAHNGIDN